MHVCQYSRIIRHIIRLFLCFHSGYRAYRDSESGSWYIGCLCEIFSEHGEKMELIKMMTLINRKVSYDFQTLEGYMKQIPCFASTLRNQVFFTPKKNSTRSPIVSKDKMSSIGDKGHEYSKGSMADGSDDASCIGGGSGTGDMDGGATSRYRHFHSLYFLALLHLSAELMKSICPSYIHCPLTVVPVTIIPEPVGWISFKFQLFSNVMVLKQIVKVHGLLVGIHGCWT